MIVKAPAPEKASMKKTSAQLDDEIAEVLSSRPSRQQLSALRPIEGLRIPAESRRELKRFWRAHPALRSGCLDKYGFDPIDAERDYWRFGLAEPDHTDVLRAVHRNDDIFALALVKRWEVEELKGPKTASCATRRTPPDHAMKKRISDDVKAAIEHHALDVIQGSYERFEIVGGKEPCVTVGLVADYLRQARMPEDFRHVTKEKQRAWTRSVLESMHRRGLIRSSLGETARCYEPKR